MNALSRRNSTDIVQSVDLNNAFSRWLTYLDVRPKTLETYSKGMRQFLKYLADNEIEEPTREDVIAFRDAMKSTRKPTTAQLYLISVRQFFKWYVQETGQPDITKDVKGITIDKEPKKAYMKPEQVRNTLKGIDRSTAQGRRDFAIFALMVTCGLRDLEVHRANIEDLRDTEEGLALFVQGKGKDDKAKYVYVPEHAERAIKASLADRTDLEGDIDLDGMKPLFISLSNNSLYRRISTRSISGIIKRSLINAGYNSKYLTAHSLRHTAVTLALESGRTLQEVQQFARHESPVTTLIYAHNLEKKRNICADTVASAIF